MILEILSLLNGAPKTNTGVRPYQSSGFTTIGVLMVIVIVVLFIFGLIAITKKDKKTE